jgi:hypothetical protein
MTQRERLFAEIKRQKEAGERLPLVSLEDFFNGNDDFGSIGCNLDDPQAVPPVPAPYWPHPGPQGFYKTLRAIRERPNVQDVLVEISDADVGEGNWPFSECVYILTAAVLEEVEAWAGSIFPTEVSEGYGDAKLSLASDLLPGYQVYMLWWD